MCLSSEPGSSSGAGHLFEHAGGGGGSLDMDKGHCPLRSFVEAIVAMETVKVQRPVSVYVTGGGR